MMQSMVSRLQSWPGQIIPVTKVEFKLTKLAIDPAKGPELKLLSLEEVSPEPSVLEETWRVMTVRRGEDLVYNYLIRVDDHQMFRELLQIGDEYVRAERRKAYEDGLIHGERARAQKRWKRWQKIAAIVLGVVAGVMALPFVILLLLKWGDKIQEWVK